MELKIIEIEAREILQSYTGANNQILEWQYKYNNVKGFKLVRTQAIYIVANYQKVPKVARKWVEVVASFGETLASQRNSLVPIKKIWIEKLLTESEKAYHIWGKVIENEKLRAMWIPKGAILQEEKKLNRIIDYAPYAKRPPMEHQKVAIEKLLANDRYILADDMGLGKGLIVNTLVYTPKGKVEVGTLKLGNKVIGADGKSYNVTGVFPQGLKDTYKITFNDGFSILTDENHLWTVNSRNNGFNTNNDRNKLNEIVLSTKQLLSKDDIIDIVGKGANSKKKYTIKTHYIEPNGNLKWQIPIVKPIEFDRNDELPIEPYLLGLALGDGSFNKYGIQFTAHKNDYDEIYSGMNITENKPSRNIRNGYINLQESIKILSLSDVRSHNKFIPEIYKYSSTTNRISLLRGLMDTDGYCMKSKKNNFNGAFYCTVSEKLCDDVIEIVHSLGGIARKSSKTPKFTYKGIKKCGKIAYIVNIKLPEGINPFKLKRKQDLYNTPTKYKVGRYIKNIEFYGQSETVCISIDSPDKLYVAEHAIVTHNTTSAIIASLESNVKKVLIVCPASLKINWRREIELYSHKKILIVEGRKWGSTFEYYIINYDILKNYHTTDKTEDSEAYKLIMNEKFDLAIIDEAHYISNTTAQRTKLLNDILEQIPKVWLLTGTPMTSRPINYFNLLKIVNSPLTLNWQQYVKRYCRGFKFKVGKTPTDGGRTVWSTSGASNLDELRERAKHLVLRRMKTDILDLPEKIISQIYLELDSSFYSEELAEFLKITEAEKGKENITITLARLMKVRQIIAIEKVPYTCELIDKFVEQEKKVIVFTNFTMSLDMIHEKYLKNSVVLDGRMTDAKKQQSVDKFQNDPKVKVLIANLRAGGVGHNLTEAEAVIMNDLSFVPSEHSQGEDRAHRYGQKHTVLVYYPIFENTIELIIYNILQRKKNIIDQVMGDGEYSESFSKELLKELF